MTDSDENHVESAWTPPTDHDADGSVDAEGPQTGRPETRPSAPEGAPLPVRVSARAQARLGVSEQLWFVVESVLLFLPYPLFLLIYQTVPVPETPFLAFTLLYSVFAIWFGFRGRSD